MKEEKSHPTHQDLAPPSHAPGPTLVVVHAVVTPRLQHRRAVRAVPAVLAAAGPDAVLAARVAGPSVAAVRGAARQRAVASIPASHAHTRPVLALAVFAAPVDGRTGVTYDGFSYFC